MAERDCEREAEVLECAASGCLGDELRMHVESCESCRDLFEVARAVVDDRAALLREAHPPGAGLVWWRMTVREQREAAHTAVRTGSFVQITLLVTAAIGALAWLGISIDLDAILKAIAASALHISIPLLVLAAACLFVAPVAVYFAVGEK